MRHWLDSDNPESGQMVSWVDEFIDKCLKEARDTGDGVVRWKDRSDRAEMSEWVKVLVARLEPFLQRDVLPYEYEAEFKFRVPFRIPDLNNNLSEIDLTGGMDILVRENPDPPVWVAYDLKATENPDYLRKTLGQGIFYSLAHLARVGTPLRTFAFIQPMVEDNPVAYTNITQADLATMMSRITKMAHDMWQGNFAPKSDSSGCAWCAVRHACPKMNGGSEKTVFSPRTSQRPA